MKQKSKRRKKSNRWSIIDRVFLNNFYTAVVIEATFVLSSLVDGIVISRFLPPTSMASFGIAFPVFSVISIFSGLISTGTQNACTQELGKGDTKEFNRVFSVSFYVSVILSGILMILFFVAAKPIAMVLGASGNGAALADGAAEYIRGFSLGVPAIILVMVVSPIIQIDSGRKRVAVSSNIDLLINIVIDLLVAYLGLGLFWVAMATTIGRYIRLIILLLHFRNKSNLLRFVPPKTSFREIIHTVSMGSEKAWRRLTNVIRPIIVNKLVLFYGGVSAMTIMSIRGNIAEVTEIVAVGLADTVGLLAALYYGEKNAEAQRALGKTVHRFWAIFSGIVSILLILFAYPLSLFYTRDSAGLAMLAFAALIGLAIQTPLQALVRPRISYLQRIHKNRDMWIVIVVSGVIFPALSAVVLGQLFGIKGVVFCYTLGDLLTLISIWLNHSLRNHRLVPTPENYLNLPDDFDISPGDIIALDIRNMEDVVLGSEQIGLFCNGHGIDKNIGKKASVCFEEIASRTVKYGFPISKTKNPIIDLKVLISKNTLTIRMQDACPRSEFAKQLEALKDSTIETAGSNLDTYVAWKLADEIRYLYSFETNTVFIDFKV